MVRRTGALKLACLLASFGLIATACSDDDEASGDRGQEGSEEGSGGESGGGLLAEVQDRGTLNCGVNDSVPGFGQVDDQGDYTGFDIEFCRAVAAGVLGDSEAVEFTPLSAEQRFTALASGEVDVLIRNTTYTASRDGDEGARFLHTTFFDGQGMMVRTDSGFTSVEDMGGTTVCVLQGTTTELNLQTRFASAGLDYEPLTFPDADAIQEAFSAGQCDGWTSDLSQLAGVRSSFSGEGGPEALTIFDDAFSKEPLGPVVRDGDDEWADAVNWSIVATVQAEEFGLTSDSVEGETGSENPDVLRFLGQPIPPADDPEADPEPFDAGLGLDPEFALNIVSQVGNYGEIYDRTVGPETGLALERGLNALWEEGGLQYAPPYR